MRVLFVSAPPTGHAFPLVPRLMSRVAAGAEIAAMPPPEQLVEAIRQAGR
ncbi:hypothetical protein FHR83_003902 [Actinoplanes campanulatus]|uniref:Uncharacterized protein n=1 Tax=Actinoplanes campanulatus TaxID=113559 RepID=A0A7W5AHJ2_9ACTN|nr:hypothetical protein [Actinoplanes campanulatus]MBB3096232.1 hypothetical protein [Actinoplanes campanulatus]